MRVVVISHTYVVAANRGKLRALAAAGHDVLLVVPRRWTNRDVGRVIDAEPGAEPFAMVTLAARGTSYGALLTYSPLGLWRAVRAFAPDVIHVEEEPWSLAALQAVLVSRRLGVPVVFFTWENLDRRLPLPSRLVQRLVLRASRGAVAGSLGAADRLRRVGFTGPIAVIPQLGVDPAAFAPGEGDTPGELVVGYVGRLVAQKGILDVLEAAAKVPQARVVLVGNGPLEPEVRRRARELGLDNRVAIHGGVRHHEVPAYLRRLSVLVLPSRTTAAWKEQFGHVLIEAMACAVPVIGSDSGAIPDVIGEAGIVVPEGDVAALAAALQRIGADAGARRDLGRRGRARVLERFTDALVAAQTAAFWGEVAGRPARVVSRTA
jgi:glycosyltransferase involved in cell wall biosynthesis